MTKETKPTTTVTKETKPNVYRKTWGDNKGHTWADGGTFASFDTKNFATKETKPTTTITKETKP